MRFVDVAFRLGNQPANIMVERREDGGWHAVVMDFGIARDSDETGITESGTVLGTASYMSPEQARGEVKRLDRRTDVYSLGATLFHLLTGRPPFVAQSTADIILKVLMEEPPSVRKLSPSVPEPIDTIVNKCLAKEPQQRYATAQELADDLGRYLAKESIVGNRVSLVARMRWRAQQNRPLAVASVSLLLALIILLGYGIRTRIVTANMEAAAKAHAAQLQQRAAVQAQLAQRLGQEITTMEWLLRSARQLPLHDLEREKVIVRKRMSKLQKELEDQGELAAGLAHYALGRGHMALHEYAKALDELRLAQSAGQDGAELHYALGIVLGKHYEQAMQEARLSGGGDWARKQLKDIAPKYLLPAITSLERARSLHLDAPQYLEALISYYQNDWERSLVLITDTQKTAPWIHEATKLAGDIHHEQALLARDSGKYELAEKEFAKAVATYEEAAESGRSDAEVYEGLAETWIRQMEMENMRGGRATIYIEKAIRAANRLSDSDSQSTTGNLKKAFAWMMSSVILASDTIEPEAPKQCIREAKAVLRRAPDDIYAMECAAACMAQVASYEMQHGGRAEQILLDAVNILESAIARNSQFIWGINDLAAYLTMLARLHFQVGKSIYINEIKKAISLSKKSISIDPGFLTALQSMLYILQLDISAAQKTSDINNSIAIASDTFDRCMKVNNKYQQCYLNYGEVYARAAERMVQAGEDAQPYLDRAISNLATARKLGDQFLDLEQFTMLAHLVDATQRVKRKQSPLPSLAELRKALPRCLALGKTDAMCLTLAAQATQVEAAWALQTGKSPQALLQKAIREAILATKSPEIYPDAWQVLADCYLQLARHVQATQRSSAIQAGQAALAKVFVINPNHAAGRGTEGELFLLAAESAQGAKKKELARAAQRALEASLSLDPLLASRLKPLQTRTDGLLAAQ